MKKFTSYLFLTSLLCFIGITLYTFKLPPFAPLQKASTQTTNIKSDQVKTNITEPIDITETDDSKVERPMSYEEKIHKGDLLAQNKYYTLAIKEYTSASHLSPDQTESYIKIGQIHLLLKSYDKAIENFLLAQSKNPANIENGINLGHAYLGQMNFDKAKETFLKLKNEHQPVAYYQALLTIYAKDYPEAKNLLQKTIQINTTEQLSKNAGNFIKSYEEYEKTAGAQEIYLKTLLSKNLNEAGEYSLAIGILKDVVKEMASYRDAWILLGYANLSIDNFNDAKTAFEKALDLDPEKTETRYFLGLAYFGMDKTEQAITNLEIALKNNFEPKIQIYQKLAEMYLLKNDFNNAIKNYEEVFKLQAGLQPDYFIRPIWIYIEHLKDPVNALKLAEKALASNPENAMSYNLLGWSYLANKNYDQARENFEKALQLNPNLGAVYLNLGKLYEEKNDLPQAKKNYKKAYELSKGDSVGNLAAERYNQILATEQNQTEKK